MVAKELETILETEEVRNIRTQYANYLRDALEEFDNGDKDFFEFQDEVCDKAEEFAVEVPLTKYSNDGKYNEEFASYLKKIVVGDELIKRHRRYLKDDKELFLIS